MKDISERCDDYIQYAEAVKKFQDLDFYKQAKAEIDRLRTRLAEIEGQEPVGHFYNRPHHGRLGVEWCCDHLDDGAALFSAPVPAIPEGWQLVPTATIAIARAALNAYRKQEGRGDLIKRLLAHAAIHEQHLPQDEEQRQWAADLLEAARMLAAAPDVQGGPVAWPPASPEDADKGWTLDYRFIEQVERIASQHTDYTTSMEATEQVLIAANEVLRASQPVEQQPVGVQGEACVACEDKPAPGNNPCGWCGRTTPPSAPVDGAIDKARFKRAPCYLCGYNGPGYYQPDTHPCAAKYHAALAAHRKQEGGVRKEQDTYDM